MHTDSRPRATVSGYATGPVTKPPTWHGLVVLDVLFNNLPTGLFLVAALGELALPAGFPPVTNWAYPLALALLALLLWIFLLYPQINLRHPPQHRVFLPITS